jgi:hypothetical protein
MFVAFFRGKASLFPGRKKEKRKKTTAVQCFNPQCKGL